MDNLFDQFYGYLEFSKIDLVSEYHQLKIRPKDIPKIVFQTRYWHYEFLMMSFGLSNALITFTSLINGVFQIFLRVVSDCIY